MLCLKINHGAYGFKTILAGCRRSSLYKKNQGNYQNYKEDVSGIKPNRANIWLASAIFLFVMALMMVFVMMVFVFTLALFFTGLTVGIYEGPLAGFLMGHSITSLYFVFCRFMFAYYHSMRH